MASRPYTSAEVPPAPAAAAANNEEAAAPRIVEKPRPRQELAVRRFSQYCPDIWGNILFHKVGTGKTLTSLLIAFNSFTEADLTAEDKKIFIVAPTTAIFGNFKKDLNDYLPNWKHYESKFVDYNYPSLISDINSKQIRYDFTGSIVIFDEAHRLLGREILNSAEAGSSVQKHPILEDIYFLNKINKAKKCIVMTGTPIQVDIADICKFLNFVTKSNDFNVETYAPATFEKTANQYGVAILTNWIKSLRDVESGAADMKALASYAASTGMSLTSFMGVLTVTGLTAAAVLAAGGYTYFQSMKRTEIETEKENRRKTRASVAKSGLPKVKVDGGSYTRKRLRGGVFGLERFPFLTPLGYTFGPAGAAKPFGEVAFKFVTETALQYFQASMEDLYWNNWQVEKLAKAASPFISIYDPDIQIKLKSSIGRYDPLGEPFNSPMLAEQLSGAKSINEMSLDSLWVKTLLDPTKALDMPKALIQIKNITYTDDQIAILREMFTGELRREYKEILNLDKYEAKTPDVNQKYKFFRAYARMIGNFSKDILNYYTVINRDGTDYDVFERNTGNKVEILPDGLFGCPKFEDCLEQLKTVRSATNTMPALDMPDTDDSDALEFNIGNFETHIQTLESLNEKDSQKQSMNLPHPHLKEGKQFLPLVYSYTEDYGLSLFCVFLKSKGYKYVLCHTNQTPDELEKRINETKSKDITTGNITVRNPGFRPIDDSNKDSVPLCVLIHPSMTEGYDFVYNPAIFVLEPCNTFGDQEQVYGRVLRSYKKSDMETFDNKKRKKVIYQYSCSTSKDTKTMMGLVQSFASVIRTKVEAVKLKAFDVGRSRLFLTPQNVINIFQKAQIESPDYFAIGRLQREKIMLKKFELSVGGGVQLADLAEAILCYSNRSDRDDVPDPCDPMSGDPCGGTGEVETTGGNRRRRRGGIWKTRRLRNH